MLYDYGQWLPAKRHVQEKEGRVAHVPNLEGHMRTWNVSRTLERLDHIRDRRGINQDKGVLSMRVYKSKDCQFQLEMCLAEYDDLVAILQRGIQSIERFPKKNEIVNDLKYWDEILDTLQMIKESIKP